VNDWMKECTITNEFTDDLDVLRLGGIAAFWGYPFGSITHIEHLVSRV
jgi:hypothetical protein